MNRVKTLQEMHWGLEADPSTLLCIYIASSNPIQSNPNINPHFVQDQLTLSARRVKSKADELGFVKLPFPAWYSSAWAKPILALALD